MAVVTAVASVSYYPRVRARCRLNEIVQNLRRIDGALKAFALDVSIAPTSKVSEASLDGSDGELPYVIWPFGPVSGSYQVTTLDKKSTFGGGEINRMTADEWETNCGQDPSSCGL